MENYLINNIDSIEQIKNFENIKKTIDYKITINFEETSIKVFHDFINKHKIKNVYMDDNYKINIDIIEYNFGLYLFFVECVDKAYNYILNCKFNLELFGNINIWNFCIVQNVMFNFPFTLENIIYIPIKYIKENYANNDLLNLTRTIIHEKLHIGQRYNEDLWSNYINIEDANWIKINKSDNKFIIIENNLKKNKADLININEEFIFNPDTYYENFKYLYKIDNNLYYGHYVYNSNNKNVSIRYFELNDVKKKLVKTNKKFEQEHPYEKYAYSISEKII